MLLRHYYRGRAEPPEIWYRYVDAYGTECVRLVRYEAVRRTPCGVWLVRHTRDRLAVEEARFVLRNARKRWACPTIEEARKSYKQRKLAQMRILKRQQERAEANYEKAMRGEFDSGNVDDLFVVDGGDDDSWPIS